MKRIKAQSFQTPAEFFATVDAIAKGETEIRRITAKRDAKILEVLADYNPYIDTHAAEIKAKIALAEKYAEEHREELLPANAKSADTALATFGFRINPPSLRLLNKKCSWEGVVVCLKAMKLGKLIRTVEEANKDAIHAAKLPTETLTKIGLKIVQPEDFYIEPKVDGAETIKGEAAS